MSERFYFGTSDGMVTARENGVSYTVPLLSGLSGADHAESGL